MLPLQAKRVVVVVVIVVVVAVMLLLYGSCLVHCREVDYWGAMKRNDDMVLERLRGRGKWDCPKGVKLKVELPEK